jgi:hypothetical protein
MAYATCAYDSNWMGQLTRSGYPVTGKHVVLTAF